MKKLIAAACVCCLMMGSISAIPASAEGMEDTVYVEDIATDVQERISGLLGECNIRVENYNGSLKVITYTASLEQMQVIGIKNLIVQYSYDGVNWNDEWNAGDFLAENTGSHQLKGYIIALERSNCYYRAVCTHYAKKSLFNTQNEQSISNDVWIG